MNAHSPGIEDELTSAWKSLSAEPILEYLDLLEDTEPARVHMQWSLIGAAASLIGKGASLYFNPNHSVNANLFVVLLGPSGTRKTTSLNIVDKFLRETSVNYGPTDSGGQRHGIMSALTGLTRTDTKRLKRTTHYAPLTPSMIHPRSPDDMLLMAPELGRLFGSSSREMADFFNDLYDQQPIDYETKASDTVIQAPLVTMLGATTSESLADILPSSAIGHGILARMVFVYAQDKYKSVPLPPAATEDWLERRARFARRLRWIDQNRVNFSIAASAKDCYEKLYEYSPHLNDPRLESYRNRRANTLLKIAMCLAGLRNDTTVVESDVQLGHGLLLSAEPTMHKALEYFGRNRVFQGRMLIINCLMAKGPGGTALRSELVAAALSELTTREAEEAISSMMASGELTSYGDIVLMGTARNAITESKGAQKNSKK